MDRLLSLGLDAELLVPEETDISLPERCRRTDYTDGDPDMEADFYLLRHTTASAVLTENFFMDSHPDCAFLLSKEGQQSLVDLHVDGVIRYINNFA